MYGTFEDIIYIADPVILEIIIGVLVALLLVVIFYPYVQRRLARPERVIASVVGFFPQVNDAARSVRRLKEAGFAANDVTVLSAIPYPEGAFETDTGRSWIRTFGFVGGIVGALTGIVLVAGTSLAFPLPTGGKPIVPIPVVLVITYELTVLTVVLFTLFRFLFEARLPSFKGKLYDPRISDGMIGVIVRCETEEQARRAEQSVSSLGASETRRVEGRVA
jgi:hypothetical protein